MNVGGDPLSPRERQIAEAFAVGETYQQIADRLNLAPSTVRTHLATIYRKLGVSTKVNLRMRIEASLADDPAFDLPSRHAARWTQRICPLGAWHQLLGVAPAR